MPKPYNLPPLGDLACFEVAARHLSFKRASAELNVTPAAVSHRIKTLEQELGQNLFVRHYRGVELTEAGALLFVALQRGLERISEGVSRIRNGPVRSGVSIAATTAVSTLWLTPRLAGFFALRPDITLSQVVQDGVAPEGVDLSIHYGDPSEVADETVVLMQGRILALGTRQFDERHQISHAEGSGAGAADPHPFGPARMDDLARLVWGAGRNRASRPRLFTQQLPRLTSGRGRQYRRGSRLGRAAGRPSSDRQASAPCAGGASLAMALLSAHPRPCLRGRPASRKLVDRSVCRARQYAGANTGRPAAHSALRGLVLVTTTARARTRSDCPVDCPNTKRA